jgi:hypothetical protein
VVGDVDYNVHQADMDTLLAKFMGPIVRMYSISRKLKDQDVLMRGLFIVWLVQVNGTKPQGMEYVVRPDDVTLEKLHQTLQGIGERVVSYGSATPSSKMYKAMVKLVRG